MKAQKRAGVNCIMAEGELECPNCGAGVSLGSIACPNCGVNLKSGETYETQVQRARGKGRHQELYTGGLYVGIVIAFSLIIFAGYMYQRTMEGVIQEKPGLISYPVQEMAEIRGLIERGEHIAANQRARDLAGELAKAIDSIEVKTPFAWEDSRRPRHGKPRESEASKRATRRLLKTLKAKAERLAEQTGPAAS